MAITEGWRSATKRALAQTRHGRSLRKLVLAKTKRAAFSGRHVRAFYAGGGPCQHASQAAFVHCKIKQSVAFRCRGKLQLQCITVRTCGRADADSCARVTPYCSVWAVGYDISCGGSDPLGVHLCGVHVRARFSRPARAKGFCPL